MTAGSPLTDVYPGMLFQSVSVGVTDWWRVIQRSGLGMWQCEIIDEPVEINPLPLPAEDAGLVCAFHEDVILAAQDEAAFEVNESRALQAAWFDSLEVGHVMHCDLGFSKFVRCEVVIGTAENVSGVHQLQHQLIGKKVLRPIALVGGWDRNEFVQRAPDGRLFPNYYAKHIVNRTGAERPWDVYIYESPAYRHYDRDAVDPCDLELVPELALQQAVAAANQ